MRKSFLTTFALALLVNAQISDVPSCALNCIITGYSNTGCALADYACQCEHIDELWDTVTPCIKAACSASDVAKVRAAVVPFCKEYGVDISLPAASATATATVVLSAASSAESTATTTGGTGSPAQSTASSSGPAATGQTSSTDTSNHAGGGGSKTPIGAIVGGVVGGLAILAVAGVTIFYIKRRHPRSAQDAAQEAAPAQSSSVLPKYEYSNAPEVAQTGQAVPYHPQAAPQPAPAYGVSELGGYNANAAHELPAVRKG